MLRFKKNDQVQVISGRDRGKRGKVMVVIPDRKRVKVEGLSLVKKHLKRSQQNPQGAVINRETPLPMDRVLPICPRCNKGVRVGFKKLEDGTKTRLCRRCEESF